MATSPTTSGTRHVLQQDPPAGTCTRHWCPDVDLSPCELPKATSGETWRNDSETQGVESNCEQQGLFIHFILPDMLSLLTANVGKSSVSLKLSLNLVAGAVNVVWAVAGGDELLLVWSVGRPCANCLQAPQDPEHSFQ